MNNQVQWLSALDIKKELAKIIKTLEIQHIDIHRLICFRSRYTKTRAMARIWALPRIWQLALNIKAYYIIEVISEKFDSLSKENQEKTLIHELLHIPKTFSGALKPHRGRYHRINDQTVEKLYQQFKRKTI